MSSKPLPKLDAGALTCPQCDHPLPADARTCPNCGVDLALVALLTERAYLEGLPGAAPIPATPEALVPRIGEYMLEQGLVDAQQLETALRQQRALSENGRHVLLGQTMVDLGFVERETLDRAINQQILELHAALQKSNRNLEQRVAERTAELQRALERLTELNQIKANLISNVSHELRTPLAHIRGYVELVAESQLGPISEEQKKALSIVQKATERLERLIADLIEFSTASREGVSLKLQIVSLRPLLEGVVERSAAKAEKASVSLVVDAAPDLPGVLADEERLGWVLFQLIDNAIKFTPEGGKVSIAARQNDHLILTSVSDTGIGIPAERVREIFEPFHQLDGSATRRYGGTGLGLALVSLILEAHGSEIQVESESGVGSTMSFQLPTVPETA